MSSFPPSISNAKDFIEKTDDDGSLQIYSYSYCDNTTSDEVKDCRGLIFNGDNLLFKSTSLSCIKGNLFFKKYFNLNFRINSISNISFSAISKLIFLLLKYLFKKAR